MWKATLKKSYVKYDLRQWQVCPVISQFLFFDDFILLLIYRKLCFRWPFAKWQKILSLGYIRISFFAFCRSVVAWLPPCCSYVPCFWLVVLKTLRVVGIQSCSNLIFQLWKWLCSQNLLRYRKGLVIKSSSFVARAADADNQKLSLFWTQPTA